jgi:hypothetical protein
MELTALVKIFTLVLGMLAFVYMLAWVFQGTTEDDERRRKPMRLGRRKHSVQGERKT